jgi:glycosyltransferase involved in cell wall biosynthesis
VRIAVVNNFFPPRPGGSSHLAAALAERYVAAGHEVLVLTAAYPGAPAEEERDGYRVVRLPAMPMPKLGLSIDFDMAFALARPGNLRRVRRLLDQFAPDVLHQHGQFFDLSWISGWYARRHKLPVLLSIHTRLESPDPKYAALFKMLDRFLVKPIITRFHPRYVIMDELAATYCTQRYGATTADFEYIPVAVEPSRFAVEPALDVRSRHGVGDAPLIVSLGHVIPLRDRLALIEALPTILDKHPDTKVMVIGRVYYDAFARRAAELGVSDAVITTGVVPSAEVPAYFAAADVVAHDLQGGGFGTASLEAMAAGRLTIGTVTETNFPAVRLRNWENFVLVPPNDPSGVADAVIRLLDDPEEREIIAKRQRDLVYAHFTLDVVTRQHLEVFERMTGRS